MGVKNFSKIFAGVEVKFAQLKNTSVAIDASILAYQSSLCMRNISALTDADGNSTIHINVIISKCINFKKNNMKQFWVFDYHEKGYVNPAKLLEIEKRSKIKEKAASKISEIKSDAKDELFSSDDEEEVHKQERIKFSMTDRIINDIKFILDCFEIPWCESPKGYEAEAICAFLTNANICDAVWTPDTDAIIYGANKVIRDIKIKSKKHFFIYEKSAILKNITIADLHKIAAISGCDHCEKSPKIGPKTILKKFKNIELTQQQLDAVKVFEKKYDVNNLTWHNHECDPITNNNKIETLFKWLMAKNFNIDRIKKQLA
jgi:5'-3' exonuclease